MNKNTGSMHDKVWREYDQAMLDAQYNTRSQIGAHYAEWSIERQRVAAAARRSLSPRVDVAYGPGPRQRLDIFPAPAGLSSSPIAVFVHGGFWRGGEKSDFSHLANGLRSLGAIVVVISYPLCPAARFEQVVETVREAVRWLVAHGAKFNGDPQRLWLFGHSAGAHLVAMCCCGDGRDEGELPSGTVKGAIMMSGMYDLEPVRLCYVNADVRLDDRDVARFSPLRLQSMASGPLIVAVGGDETAEFHRQARDFSSVLEAQGAHARMRVVPNANHYTVVGQLATAGSPLLREFRAMLDG